MIKQAIIPLAGLGTRLLPLTSVMPKELLPINGKPNLEYILDECLEAGVKQFIFIISKEKISIKKYFFNDLFYKKIIKKKKDKRIIEEFRKIKKYQKMIKFVYQNKPTGTGDAVLNTVTGNANSSSWSGSMTIFNPSSTTFVKHFISQTHTTRGDSDGTIYNWFGSGYANTTSAVDAIRFNFASGNIDSGTIKLYGIKDS